MIRKTMFLGNYAAEFHLDPKSDPPKYNYAIVQKNTRMLLLWGRAPSVPEVMRFALETLELLNAEDGVAPSANEAAAAAALTKDDEAPPQSDKAFRAAS
jgi:hypothetical protein